MREFQAVDILLALPLMASVPILVFHYLSGPGFTQQFRSSVTWCGVLWVLFSLINESFVYDVLGLGIGDSAIHARVAASGVSMTLPGDKYLFGMFPMSNTAYREYLRVLHSFSGASVYYAAAINGWASFCGGLALARFLAQSFPAGPGGSGWLFATIFFPSTVFWTSANLKEGFMYWSICQVMASSSYLSTMKMPLGSLASAGFGALVGTIFRPHVMGAWLAAAAFVTLLGKGKKIVGILLLVGVIGAVSGLRGMTGVDIASDSVDTSVAYMQKTASGVRLKGASDIDFGDAGPVFFVSGFTSIFFRPFPWEIRNLRLALCSLETWTLTLVLIWGWLRMTEAERMAALRLPSVRTAILVCLVFSALFSYFPNEGLIARQRVQMVPAVLTLAFVPYLQRMYLLRKLEARRRAATFGPGAGVGQPGAYSPVAR